MGLERSNPSPPPRSRSRSYTTSGNAASVRRAGRSVAFASGPGQDGGLTRYELLLFLHVFAAIVWIGLSLVGMSMAVWADRYGEHAFVEPVYRWVAWIEPPAIVLGPLLLIVTGIALVLDGPWRFGDTWIAIGLTGYVAALALGLVLQAPGTKRMKTLMEERGPEDPETIAATRRLDAFLWPELGILLVVLLTMTTKPIDGGTAGFWSAVLVILLVSIALMVRGLRSAELSSAPVRPPA